MLVIVEVTETDIECGERDDCTECPVARAFARLANCYVEVTNREAIFYRGSRQWTPGTGVRVELPIAARMFIQEYDRNTSLATPCSFPATVPDDLLKSET